MKSGPPCVWVHVLVPFCLSFFLHCSDYLQMTGRCVSTMLRVSLLFSLSVRARGVCLMAIPKEEERTTSASNDRIRTILTLLSPIEGVPLPHLDKRGRYDAELARRRPGGQHVQSEVTHDIFCGSSFTSLHATPVVPPLPAHTSQDRPSHVL